jgi:hypothetical protein
MGRYFWACMMWWECVYVCKCISERMWCESVAGSLLYGLRGWHDVV